MSKLSLTMLLVAFAALGIFASSTLAAPIINMDGTFDQYFLTAVGGSGIATLSIADGEAEVTTLNGVSLGANDIPSTFNNMQIMVDANGNPSINFNAIKTIGPGAGVTGQDVFSASLGILLMTNNALIIEGNEVLTTDGSTLDLSLFPVGSLVMTFNTPNTNLPNFQQIFDFAASGTGTLTTSGSGSFSQSNITFPVPEPASMALWALVMGLVACGFRLFQQSRNKHNL